MALDLDQVTTFVRIVEAGSLTGAARTTRQSLATVSRQLKALEEALGTTLVRRTTRRLWVNPTGHTFYGHALRILREVEAAQGIARGGSLRGRLTISIPVTLGQHLLVPRLLALMKRHPDLELEVRLDDRLADLVVEGVDLVVRAGAPLPDSTAFVAVKIEEFSRILVAAPKLAQANRRMRAPAELARLACLLQVGPSGAVRRWRLVRGPAEETVEVQGRLSSSAPLVLRDAAAAGAGVGFLPTWLVEGSLKDGTLKRLLPEWSSAGISAWAMYRRELRGSPSVRAVVEALGARFSARDTDGE